MNARRDSTDRSRTHGSGETRWRCAGVCAVLCALAMSPAYADDLDLAYTGNYEVKRTMHSLPVETTYALGVDRYDVDAHTEIIGWQLPGNWYFGRQDGLDSGLTLVWQQDERQVSLSKDGLRLTRRF